MSGRLGLRVEAIQKSCVGIIYRILYRLIPHLHHFCETQEPPGPVSVKINSYTIYASSNGKVLLPTSLFPSVSVVSKVPEGKILDDEM